jgi:hypothetical protein
MALKIPRFKETACQIITVCGMIEKNQKHPLADLMKDRDELVASIRIAQKPGFLRLMAGSKKGLHLHVDCVLQEFFSRRHVPKVTCKKKDITDILAKMEGIAIDAGLAAGFKIITGQLPEKGLINSFATEQKTADMSMKLTGGTLKIEGAPVKRLVWTLGKDSVRVRLEAERKERVDDAYVSRCFDWMKTQFDLFVLGKAPDENA